MRLELRKEPSGPLLGFACIEHGVAVVYGGLRSFDGRTLWDEDVRPISQADGEVWLRALRTSTSASSEK